MAIMGKHGVTDKTPGSILLGAGTFHKNLKFEGSKWSGDVIGATSGGGKIAITNELKDLEIDGVLVKTKGLTNRWGGTATMEINFVELTSDLIETTGLMMSIASTAEGYNEYRPAASIAENHYIENLGFVGLTGDGRQIIVIFDYALCTSGLEIEGKNKENAVFKATFEACANLDNSNNYNALPVRIYYPDLPSI